MNMINLEDLKFKKVLTIQSDISYLQILLTKPIFRFFELLCEITLNK